MHSSIKVLPVRWHLHCAIACSHSHVALHLHQSLCPMRLKTLRQHQTRRPFFQKWTVAYGFHCVHRLLDMKNQMRFQQNDGFVSSWYHVHRCNAEKALQEVCLKTPAICCTGPRVEQHFFEREDTEKDVSVDSVGTWVLVQETGREERTARNVLCCCMIQLERVFC